MLLGQTAVATLKGKMAPHVQTFYKYSQIQNTKTTCLVQKTLPNSNEASISANTQI